MENKARYEIRQIDAWGNEEEGYTWNESIKIGEFTTAAADHKNAFLRALRKMGIVCQRGKCKVDFDGDIYELTERKSGMPIMAAIPMN